MRLKAGIKFEHMIVTLILPEISAKVNDGGGGNILAEELHLNTGKGSVEALQLTALVGNRH